MTHIRAKKERKTYANAIYRIAEEKAAMITIFSSPKPFKEHFGIIQRNAIRSWSLLHPRCEIMLFGDEEGTAEIAKELGARHFAHVACNEFKTPLLSDMFEKARKLAAHDLLCFVNSDIILMSDFMRAATQVVSFAKQFMMVGERWDLNVESPLSFDLHWEAKLIDRVRESAKLQYPAGVDYFLFHRGLLGSIPPFAIGRPAWDNWLLYHSRSLGALLIDATETVIAVHQNHDYSHAPGGKVALWTGVEARQNKLLYQAADQFFTFEDATHKLTSNGIKLAIDYKRIVRRLETIPTLHPRAGLLMRLPAMLISAWRLKGMKMGSVVPYFATKTYHGRDNEFH